MLLTEEVPYKCSLCGPAALRAMGVPFQLCITVACGALRGAGRQYSVTLRAPPMRHCEATVLLGALRMEGGVPGEVGYVFLELLDDESRPTGAPMPVAVLSGSLLTRVHLPLQPGQLFAFHLIKAGGAADKACSLLVDGRVELGLAHVGRSTLARALQWAAGWGATSYAFSAAEEMAGGDGVVEADGAVPDLIYAQVEGGEDES